MGRGGGVGLNAKTVCWPEGEVSKTSGKASMNSSVIYCTFYLEELASV